MLNEFTKETLNNQRFILLTESYYENNNTLNSDYDLIIADEIRDYLNLENVEFRGL